ncbi:MAG: hypothetical protein WBA23_18315 [Tunicatimonas sp.]|uniref:hypothetical protein n=1 Tax=Tunicatimonas sp. TaxID=1940096 RepID=UPI003C73EBD9
MQITSQRIKDADAISLTEHDMHDRSLKQNSNIRPNRLFTADNLISFIKSAVFLKRSYMKSGIKS